MKLAVVIFVKSNEQNHCFWPTYMAMDSGQEHDLILAYANMNLVPDDAVNKDGMIVFEKVAYATKPMFHVYKDIFEMHKEDYDMFCFVTEDVVIRKAGWLKKITDMLSGFRGLGFVSTQVFNGCNNQYPPRSHIRLPVWAAITEALDNIDWEFGSNIDPEMELADRFVEAGFYGAQVGNKINVAFDALTNHGFYTGDHVTALMSKLLGCGLDNPFTDQKTKEIHSFLVGKLKSRSDSLFVQSPFDHIGKRHVISQLQPFHGLIYDKSLPLVPNMYIKRHPFDIVTLADCLEEE